MNIFTRAEYGHHYNHQKLFSKLQKLPGKILATLLFKTFLLYELLKEHDTSVFLKAAIVGTLGYLVCPIDAIPDMLPGGYIDDMALMTSLLAGIDHLISDEIKRKASVRAKHFKGGDAVDDGTEEDT